MFYNMLVFGFPVYLIVFELLFRTFSHLDTSGFIGPTLGAAGLSLLIPLVKPKPVVLSSEELVLLQRNGLTIKDVDDEKLIMSIWIFILVGVLIWYWACATSFKSPEEMIFMFPKHLCIGLINYLAGIIFSTIKETI